jgi:GAF domain-containing protein
VISRLPADFIDRLRDLLSAVQAEQVMMRPELDDARLDRIARLAMTQTGAAAALLLLVNEDRRDLTCAAVAGADDAKGRSFAMSGIAAFVIEDGNPVALADVPGVARGRDEVEERTGVTAKSFLAAPLLTHGRAAGALVLLDAGDQPGSAPLRPPAGGAVGAPLARGFTPAQIELAVELASLAAAAVEEFRGDRFLYALFQAALPRALDPAQGPESLRDELRRWLEELRSTPAWRAELDLVLLVREICRRGDDSARMARRVLEAIADRERAWPR